MFLSRRAACSRMPLDLARKNLQGEPRQIIAENSLDASENARRLPKIIQRKIKCANAQTCKVGVRLA